MIKLADHLSLPLEVVTQTIGLLAKRRAGKSYTIRRLIEQLFKAGQQIVVVDPKGDMWGIRSSSDGKKPGLPIVIFGGEHGDVPLEAGNGETVARLVVEERVNLLIDLSLFRKHEVATFMTAFLETLYRLKAREEFRTAMCLVIDEADAICLSNDTELLTKRGWLKHAEIQLGDEAVCFDLTTATYSYGAVQAIQRRYYSGQMVRLQTKSLDVLSTPDHRTVLRRQQRAKGRKVKLYPWTFCPASRIPTSIGIPSGGAPAGAGLPNLTLQQLRIMGWIISDGNIHDHRPSRTPKIVLEQSWATKKRDVRIAGEMDAVFKMIPGVTRYERPARVTTSGGRMRKHDRTTRWYLGGTSSEVFLKWLSPLNRIPRRILEQCSCEQLEALWTGLFEGDGCSRAGKWISFHPGLCEGLADDLQELGLRLGINTVKSRLRNQWVVHIANTRKYHWVRKPNQADYDGLVWDVTVPTGAFVARRNGRVFVTGNCPQRPQKGEERMLGAAEDVVRRGGQRGIGCVMATQRPAVLNKNVLTQVQILVALRTIAPQDLAALNAWIEVHGTIEQKKMLMESLPSLPVGDAWFWSPGWPSESGIFKRVHVLPIETFDSGATPKPGEKRIQPKNLADVNLDALRKQMAETLEKAKQNDPKLLKKEIADLRKQLGAKQPPAKEVDRQDVEGAISQAKREMERQVAKYVGEVERTVKRMNHAIEVTGTQIKALGDLRFPDPPKLEYTNLTFGTGTTAGTAARIKVVDPPQRRQPVIHNVSTDAKLGKCEQAIAAFLSANRSRSWSKAQVGMMIGYSPKSSMLDKSVSNLSTAGILSRQNGQLQWIGGIEVDSSGYEFSVTNIRSRLDKCSLAIFDVLMKEPEREFDKHQIGELTAYSEKSSMLDKSISRLSSMGVATRTPGKVRLSDDVKELL